MFEAIKIDTFTYNDYDKVIRFLLKKEVAIRRRNKTDMVIIAEMTPKLAQKMTDTINTEEHILCEPA